MHRSLSVAVAAIALCAVTPTVAAKPRSACQRLKAAHEDLSPNRKLVLVQRGSFETGAIVACLLPRGRVRRLARWDDGLGRAGADVVRTKGSFVLIRTSWNDQYGGSDEALSRVDVRTGRAVRLTSYGCMGPCSSGTTFGKVVLSASGAGALEVADFAASAMTLEVFGRGGALTRLDDGPVDALRLDGAEVVWWRAGEERRAPLPG